MMLVKRGSPGFFVIFPASNQLNVPLAWTLACHTNPDMVEYKETLSEDTTNG